MSESAFEAAAAATGAAPSVAVVIVGYHSAEHLPACLGSLPDALDGTRWHAVVVDNASSDGTEQLARDLGADVVALPENVGFSRAVNTGLRHAPADVAVVLNPDTRAAPGSLARLVDVVANDETVAVASASLRHDDLTPMTVVHASFHLFGPAVRRLLGVGRIGFGRQAPGTVPVQGVHDVTWVTGACLAARSSVLERLGGFDDGFFLYEEDADLQYRAHELGRVVVVGDAVVVHAQGGSASHSGEEARGARLATAQVRFIAKHQGRVAATMYAALAVLRYLPNAVAERFTRRPRWYSAKVGALVRQATVEWR